MSDLVSSFLKTSFLILDCQNWHIVTIYKLDNNLCCERKLKYRAAHEWCHGGNLRNKCRQKENNIFNFLNFFLYAGQDVPDNLETISAVTSLMGHTVGKFIYSEKPTKIRRNFHADFFQFTFDCSFQKGIYLNQQSLVVDYGIFYSQTICAHEKNTFFSREFVRILCLSSDFLWRRQILT